jgi:hypothetical protein
MATATREKKTINWNVPLTPTMAEQLKERADSEGRTGPAIMRLALARYLSETKGN